MNVEMLSGKLFLSALIKQGSTPAILEYKEIEPMLKPGDKELFGFVKSFAKEEGKLPSLKTLEAHMGIDLPDADELPSYYLKILEHNYQLSEIKKIPHRLKAVLEGNPSNVEGAVKVLSETLANVVSQKPEQSMIDPYAYGRGWAAHYKGKHENKSNFRLGWPMLDAVSGNLGKGDVVSFVGRTGIGKSFFLLHSALHGCNVPVLFASMELSMGDMLDRFAAIKGKLPLDGMMHGNLNKEDLDAFLAAKEDWKEHPHAFKIVDFNLAATVENILALAKQLKPGAIYIDGAYLLGNANEENLYAKVSLNTRLIKQLLAPLCPVICSWQFNRERTGKNSDPDLENIGFSYEIGQVSTLVIGILEDDADKSNPNAHPIRRRMKILKNRKGKLGSFYTNWAFDSTDFSEWEDDISKLSFNPPCHHDL